MLISEWQLFRMRSRGLLRRAGCSVCVFQLVFDFRLCGGSRWQPVALHSSFDTAFLLCPIPLSGQSGKHEHPAGLTFSLPTELSCALRWGLEEITNALVLSPLGGKFLVMVSSPPRSDPAGASHSHLRWTPPSNSFISSFTLVGYLTPSCTIPC